MGKRKKEIAAQHAAKKEEIRKEAEKKTALDGLHRLLIWLKLILVVSMVGNIYMLIKNGTSSGSKLDLVFNIIFLILMVLSIIWHNHKKGVYFFFGYGILELLYEYIVAFVAYRQGIFDETVGNKLFEYTFFSAIMLIPIYIYYKKRMSLLKP